MKSTLLLLSLAIAFQSISGQHILNIVKRLEEKEVQFDEAIVDYRSDIISAANENKLKLSETAAAMHKEVSEGPEACQTWLEPIVDNQNELDSLYTYQSCRLSRDFVKLSKFENYISNLLKRAESLKNVCMNPKNDCVEEIAFLDASLQKVDNEMAEDFSKLMSNVQLCVAIKGRTIERRLEHISLYWKACAESKFKQQFLLH